MGDGPGPPGILTGPPCQAAAFMAAIPRSIASAICAWRSSGMVYTSCLYVQPLHRPRIPKFRQLPLFPDWRSEIFTPPFRHRSSIVRVGNALLNAPTAF